MQMKPLLIGLAVLAVATIAGLGIWSAMDKDDTKASTTTSTNKTNQEDTAPMNEQNITELAAGTESLSTLVAAVKAAGLAETLADPNAQFTVFAPSNDAFAKLPAGTVDTLVKPENKDLLTTILTYHVVPAVAMSGDLTDGQKIKTVQGTELTVKLQDGKVWIVDAKGGMAQVTTADVKASNGVVHIIDNVLMPQ